MFRFKNLKKLSFLKKIIFISKSFLDEIKNLRKFTNYFYFQRLVFGNI